MNQQIPGSVEEYIDIQLLGSAKDFQMTSDLKAVGALQYNNNTIIYGIMVPDTRKDIPQEAKEGGRTRLSKDLSECLNGENLGNWIMLAQPTDPDYQKFLKYIVIQAYEENNTDNLLSEIEIRVIRKFLSDNSLGEEREQWTEENNSLFFTFMMARLSFYEGKLKETGNQNPTTKIYKI